MRIFVMLMIGVIFGANLVKGQEGGELEPIVVEASRSNDTAGQMNKDVTVITAADIAASPAQSLPQLLSQEAGIDARTNSSIKDTQINMGQFGESSTANVLILVDGRRLNTADLAAPDLSLIDLNSVDHIEIIQGAGSVLYGDNADGGVINIVTKKGIANTKPSVLLTSEVGSYKGTKEGMYLTGGLPKLSYQFDYAHQQSNNYRTNNL
ncbi:MAG: TonB-dependent receptor, partial [Candidatus Omnitrophica bacterium]|nr:TonB-dependent receptor [Candidatus Omnitrophota bacterium]